ncbi:hypothetical protein P4O66_002228 [Electrophorus voltai]|uniref:Uncharacterized protein n=1 Tax=Electrophorus voltai TaxID=2609070 RepID=A0AAD8Z235_9TELE|nr:hypothetical protein P4O66_002228 [Electrophorus voltai]
MSDTPATIRQPLFQSNSVGGSAGTTGQTGGGGSLTTTEGLKTCPRGRRETEPTRVIAAGTSKGASGAGVVRLCRALPARAARGGMSAHRTGGQATCDLARWHGMGSPSSSVPGLILSSAGHMPKVVQRSSASEGSALQRRGRRDRRGKGDRLSSSKSSRESRWRRRRPPGSWSVWGVGPGLVPQSLAAGTTEMWRKLSGWLRCSLSHWMGVSRSGSIPWTNTWYRFGSSNAERHTETD